MPRARAFICDLCGKEMPLGEISTHKQMSHPQALQTIQRANQHWIRRFCTIFAPGVAALVVPLFVLAFGVYVSRWYILGGLWGLIASMPAGWWYAQKKTQREFAEQSSMLENMPYRCWVCEVLFPRKDVRIHFATEHPHELQYLKTSKYASFWSLLGFFGAFFILVSASILDLLPGAMMEILLIWTSVAMLACIGFIIFWILLVDPRHRAKARAAWRTTHFGSQAHPK